jgi:NAD(P)-dependent dehydrogenase (short-subunit alcohol dehydrogenase family)
MPEFSERVAVVTGAAGNLGGAVARAFHAAGAKLALIDRDAERLRQAYADIADAPTCLLRPTDLTNAEAVTAMAEEVQGHFGRIDVLANIAGGFAMGPRVHETPVETWDFMLGLNARTAFLASRAVVPHMLAQGSGKIVNVAARAALEGKARMAPYIVSKAAVIRLTESMAAELRDAGINVNCILPGTIDTPQNRRDMPDADHSRWVPPAALADVILFLASDAARAVQGAALPVYGRS